MTSEEDHCQMAERIVQLETKQQFISEELTMNQKSIERNTEAINKLCKTLIEHDAILQQQHEKGTHLYAIITGVTVGVVMLVIEILRGIM